MSDGGRDSENRQKQCINKVLKGEKNRKLLMRNGLYLLRSVRKAKGNRVVSQDE